MEIARFRLAHDTARNRAIAAVRSAPDNYVVTISPPRRNLDQNAKFHSLVSDISKACPKWNGLTFDADDWKALLIVSHAIATGGDAAQLRLVPDLEGKGFIQLRESSARMSKERASSLIEYVTAWATSHGIPLREPAPKGER